MDINQNVISTKQCANAFGRMFWAYLFFIPFALRTGNDVKFDLLSDCIGWLIFASALTKILALSERVANIRTLVYWLAFLSLFAIAEDKITLADFDLFNISLPQATPSGRLTALLYGLFPVTLKALLIWRLCGLIVEIAHSIGNSRFASKAIFYRKFYLATEVIFTVIGAVFIPVIPSAPIIFAWVVIAIPTFLSRFYLLLRLLKGTQKMCQRYGAQQAPAIGTST